MLGFGVHMDASTTLDVTIHGYMQVSKVKLHAGSTCHHAILGEDTKRDECCQGWFLWKPLSHG